jgi:hypothetical protein
VLVWARARTDARPKQPTIPALEERCKVEARLSGAPRNRPPCKEGPNGRQISHELSRNDCAASL